MKKTFAWIGAVCFSLLLILSSCKPAESEETAHMLDWQKLDTPIAYYQEFADQKITLNVYNWGEYISDGSDDSMDINAEFEALTGIKVNYTNYPSNEDLYAKLKSGATSYDIVVPSDYMIARLIGEGMLEKIDMDHVPNDQFIMDHMKHMQYDPDNEYSVPYTWGTVGIIYNKKFVDEADVHSWSVLWNEKYAKKILMFRNSRDAFGIAQKLLGYSFNSTDPEEYRRCAEKLKEQKNVVKIYVMDEVFDKMIAEETWIAPYYAGDALTMIADNPNLAFSVPKEGTNMFLDSLCIPKGTKNKKAAELYINFLNETQVAKANIEYLCYSSPHKKAIEQLDEETRNNPIVYPDNATLKNTEVFLHLPEKTNAMIDKLWEDILMSQDEDKARWVFPVAVGLAFLATVVLVIVRAVRKHKNAQY